jgi:hypothetical protein
LFARADQKLILGFSFSHKRRRRNKKVDAISSSGVEKERKMKWIPRALFPRTTIYFSKKKKQKKNKKNKENSHHQKLIHV